MDYWKLIAYNEKINMNFLKCNFNLNPFNHKITQLATYFMTYSQALAYSQIYKRWTSMQIFYHPSSHAQGWKQNQNSKGHQSKCPFSRTTFDIWHSHVCILSIILWFSYIIYNFLVNLNYFYCILIIYSIYIVHPCYLTHKNE
jgi:hypothetical protein